MTTPVPSDPVVEGVTEAIEAGDERVKITGGLRKLLWWMMPANLGVFILWGAIPGVLLPLQLQPLPFDVGAFHLDMVYPAQRERDAALQWLIERIAEVGR